MAARSIASLTLGFGLVSIPVKLYSATESSASIRFNLLAKDGSRVRQQYVSEKDGKVVERADGLQAAIKAAGGIEALAPALGLDPAAVASWHRIPVERLLQIEALTELPRRVLRPDLG